MAVVELTEIPALIPRYSALIGLDLGEKTIGVAVSDTTRMVASPLELIRKTGELSAGAPPPCILITGHAFEAEDHEERNLPHFKEVVPKPFRWQLLAALIVRHWPEGEPSPVRSELHSI